MNYETVVKDGTEHLVIPKDTYEDMVGRLEDLSDIAAGTEVKSAIERGDEEALPSEFVDRMLDGESLVKLWREHRELSQTALANASEVNRVQIADIEAGRSNGSVATMKKLADALGVSIDDLV